MGKFLDAAPLVNPALRSTTFLHVRQRLSDRLHVARLATAHGDRHDRFTFHIHNLFGLLG